MKPFLISFASILLLDFLWLGLLMTSFYVRNLEPIGRFVEGKLQPQWLPALGVYLLLSFGISRFALVDGGELVSVILRGALLGLIVYGVYDLTNMATLKSWPLPLALVDMAWGSFLCATVAGISHWLR